MSVMRFFKIYLWPPWLVQESKLRWVLSSRGRKRISLLLEVKSLLMKCTLVARRKSPRLETTEKSLDLGRPIPSMEHHGFKANNSLSIWLIWALTKRAHRQVWAMTTRRQDPKSCSKTIILNSKSVTQWMLRLNPKLTTSISQKVEDLLLITSEDSKTIRFKSKLFCRNRLSYPTR